MSTNVNKNEICKRNEAINKQCGKTYIQLLHGRKEPDEQLDDWGFDGPALGPIEWVHITYNNTINIKFENEPDASDICLSEKDGICLTDDLFYYDGNYYGDWEIVVHQEQIATDIESYLIGSPIDAEEHRVRLLCDSCGSENIYAERTASWDIDTQQWELNDPFESTVICNDCGLTNAQPNELSLDLTHIELTDNQWKAQFKPITNYLDDNASWDGLMYETYGPEFEHIKSFAKTSPNYVWTLVSDDNGNPMIGSGLHWVNRMGYFITKNPFRCDVSVIDELERSDDEFENTQPTTVSEA